MDKLYEQAKDLHVIATFIYNNGRDELAYKDPECTQGFSAVELREAFMKGALIKLVHLNLDKTIAIPLNSDFYIAEGEGVEDAVTLVAYAIYDKQGVIEYRNLYSVSETVLPE